MIRKFCLPQIRGSEDCSDWEGPQEFFGLTFSSQQGQLWGQTRLLRSTSIQGLETSKDRNCTTSSGNLCHCLTLFMRKQLSLYPLWPSLLSTYVSCLLPFYQRDEPNPGPSELLAGTAAAVRYFQSHLCSKVSISSSSNFSSQHKCSSSHHSGGFCWTVSSSLMSSLYCGQKVGGSMQMCYSECWAEVIITLVLLVPMQPRMPLAVSASGACFWPMAILLPSRSLGPFPQTCLPNSWSLCHLEGIICPRYRFFAFVLVEFCWVLIVPFSQSLWITLDGSPVLKDRSCPHPSVWSQEQIWWTRSL